MLLTIHLNHVKFFAYHGLYETEKITGNEFELNAIIHYHPQVAVIKHIHETINYAEVYELIKHRMEDATPLLETVVMEIAKEILARFEQAEHVFVSLAKLKPPIDNFEGSVAVSVETGRQI
ncbi:dihydroneopterin aldolase [Chitinophagaceae bacterium LWZ2-11]